MVLRRYALSIIALAILESGQWLRTKKDIPCKINPKSLTNFWGLLQNAYFCYLVANEICYYFL